MAIYVKDGVRWIERASGAFKLGSEVFDITSSGVLRKLAQRGGAGTTGRGLIASGEQKLLADPVTASARQLTAGSVLTAEASDVGQAGAADIVEMVGMGAREAASASGIAAESAENAAAASLIAKADMIAANSGKELDQAIIGSSLGQKLNMAAGDFKTKFLLQVKDRTWWRRLGAFLAVGGAGAAVATLVLAPEGAVSNAIDGAANAIFGSDSSSTSDFTKADAYAYKAMATRIKTVCAGSRMTPEALVSLMELMGDDMSIVKAVTETLDY